jgi:transcriptional regulator with XRE-family HTH domain
MADLHHAENISGSVNIRFGNRLRRLREESGAGAEEFASRLHMPVSRLRQMEGGGSSTSLLELYSLATALGLSVSVLLKDV